MGRKLLKLKENSKSVRKFLIILTYIIQLQGKRVCAEEQQKSFGSSPEKVHCQKKNIKKKYFLYFLLQNSILELDTFVRISSITELLFIINIEFI